MYGGARIEIKHLYLCFIAVLKYGYSFLCARVIKFIRTRTRTRTHILLPR